MSLGFQCQFGVITKIRRPRPEGMETVLHITLNPKVEIGC